MKNEVPLRATAVLYSHINNHSTHNVDTFWKSKILCTMRPTKARLQSGNCNHNHNSVIVIQRSSSNRSQTCCTFSVNRFKAQCQVPFIPPRILVFTYERVESWYTLRTPALTTCVFLVRRKIITLLNSDWLYVRTGNSMFTNKYLGSQLTIQHQILTLCSQTQNIKLSISFVSIYALQQEYWRRKPYFWDAPHISRIFTKFQNYSLISWKNTYRCTILQSFFYILFIATFLTTFSVLS